MGLRPAGDGIILGDPWNPYAYQRLNALVLHDAADIRSRQVAGSARSRGLFFDLLGTAAVAAAAETAEVLRFAGFSAAASDDGVSSHRARDVHPAPH